MTQYLKGIPDTYFEMIGKFLHLPMWIQGIVFFVGFVAILIISGKVEKESNDKLSSGDDKKQGGMKDVDR